MAAVELNKQIGERLRSRRIILGMSQSQLGFLIGVTFQQIQKYESGANNITAPRLYKFAEVMQVPVAYFFENTMPLGLAKCPTPRNKGISDRECLEVMKAFQKIESPLTRKRVADLVRGIAGY